MIFFAIKIVLVILAATSLVRYFAKKSSLIKLDITTLDNTVKADEKQTLVNITNKTAFVIEAIEERLSKEAQAAEIQVINEVKKSV